MIRTIALSSLIVFAMASSTLADILTVNGIPSFDTNLGTLISVTVEIDPLPTQTSSYQPSLFENVSTHNHIVNPFPVIVPGLPSFSFAPTPTDSVNPAINESHFHVVDIPPSQQFLFGTSLSWFLNPANGVIFVNLGQRVTSEREGHTHGVNFAPVLPQTTFEFTPVPATIPEPTSGALLGLGCCLFASRRRRRCCA